MHTHLEQWAADIAAPGEQLGVWCLAQESHLSHGQFLPEPRFVTTEPRLDLVCVVGGDWGDCDSLTATNQTRDRRSNNAGTVSQNAEFRRTWVKQNGPTSCKQAAE